MKIWSPRSGLNR